MRTPYALAASALLLALGLACGAGSGECELGSYRCAADGDWIEHCTCRTVFPYGPFAGGPCDEPPHWERSDECGARELAGQSYETTCHEQGDFASCLLDGPRDCEPVDGQWSISRCLDAQTPSVCEDWEGGPVGDTFTCPAGWHCGEGGDAPYGWEVGCVPDEVPEPPPPPPPPVPAGQDDEVPVLEVPPEL